MFLGENKDYGKAPTIQRSSPKKHIFRLEKCFRSLDFKPMPAPLYEFLS